MIFGCVNERMCMKYEMLREKVSIILPVYNAERYIENVLDDLLAQTYDEIEIIVIDDGSTDNSWEKINQYIHDARIKAFKVENAGASRARNIGLGYAQGKYIRFVDADDRLPNHSIQRLVEVYEQNPDVDLVIGNYTYVSNKSCFTGDLFEEGAISQKDFIKDFMRYAKSYYFGVPWNKLYKREIIEKENICFCENLSWCEDFLFNLEYYKRCKTIYRINVEGGIYCYWQREDSITSQLSKWPEEKVQEIETLRYENAIKLCEQCGMGEEFRLEWKYSALYATLSDLAKQRKYHEFCTLLKDKEVETYIKQKQTDLDMKVWKYIRKSVDKKRYFLLFFFFIIKGWTAERLAAYMPKLLERIRKKFPKRV